MPRTTIGLISDTHGWLHPLIPEIFKDTDHIIHAGDIGHGHVIEQLELIAPTTVVRGNIDGGNLRFLPLTEVVDIAGKRIAVLHIAGSPFSPKRAALKLIDSEKPDAIVVGHSHIQVVGRVKGCLWLNPGAAGNHGFHEERTANFLHIEENGEFALDKIHLGQRGEKVPT